MGYTHYWDMPSEVPEENWEEAINNIQKVVEKHKDILVFEYDESDKPPMVDLKKGIRFNGIGDDGHETFVIVLGGKSWDFCKTARKPYDQAVCECLLILQAAIPGFKVSSDGFSGYLKEQKEKVRLDGTWDQAIEAVKEYGYHYTSGISNERDPYCDLEIILEGTWN